MVHLTNKMTSQEKRDYVLNELKENLQSIRIIKQAEESEEKDYQRKDDGLYREPLSIEKEICIKILLSWGGGEDGFKLYFTDEELLRGVYYCADWGEYEEVDLNEDELELIYNFYLNGEYID